MEIAFTTGPDAQFPAWVDVTADVDSVTGITSNRGRGDEIATIEPGKLSFTLFNDDGRYTFGLESSPYWPDVVPMRRVRYSLQVGGYWHVRWDGTVDGFPTKWERGGADTVAPITATELLARPSRLRLLRSVLHETIMLTGPAAYYPLGEPEGSLSAGDLSGNAHPPLTVAQAGTGGAITFGGSTGPPADEASSPTFAPASATDGLYLTGGGDFGSGTGLTISAFTLRAGDTPGPALSQNVFSVPLRPAAGEVSDEINVFFQPDGSVMVQRLVRDAAYAFSNKYLISAAAPPGTFHVAVTDAAGSAKLYLNGSLAASAAYTARSQHPVGLVVGADPTATGVLYCFNGTVSHVAVHTRVLTGGTLTEIAAAGLTGFAGELSGQRIGRWLGWLGLDTVAVLASGDAAVGHIPTSGRSVLDAVKDVLGVEFGEFFYAPGIGFVFRARSDAWNQSPVLTLDCADDHIQPDFTTVGDTQFLENDVTVTRQGGASARVTNQASKDMYGEFSAAATVYAATDGQALAVAQYRVARYGEPEPRSPSVTVDLLTCPELETDAISTGIGSLIELNNLLPASPGAAVTYGTSAVTYGTSGWAYAAAPGLLAAVEGLTESVGHDRWTVTYSTSPGHRTFYWQLGVAGHSELGLTTRLALG